MKNEEKPVPILSQINLVVKNIPASIAFYRRLGLTVEQAGHPEWAAHHATAVMSNGMRLEFDSESFAKQWNPGWNDRKAGSLGVLFFAVSTREDVDRCTRPCVPSVAPASNFLAMRSGGRDMRLSKIRTGIPLES